MPPEACYDDEALYPLAFGEAAEPAVQRHVGTCPSCHEKLDRLKAEATIISQCAQDEELAAELSRTATWLPDRGAQAEKTLPAAIGRYRPKELLARGGQADVYLADHLTLPKLELVVKWYHGQREIDHERLKREAELLTTLEHDGLARVFDLDTQEMRPYLVMEYVRGRSLGAYAGQNRLTPRRAAALVAGAAEALGAAHAHGVAHLDLTPANILVDERGRPRIIDFGMAKICDPWREHVPPAGGTAWYMSPEQAEAAPAGEGDGDGNFSLVGPPSDIFSLGAVLYFLLAGRPPYLGSRATALQQARIGAIDDTALKQRRVPYPLRKICLRAMAKDPAARYATAGGLARALKGFAFVPKRRELLAAAAGLAALALVGWIWPTAPPEPPVSQQIVEILKRQGTSITPKDDFEDLARYIPLESGDELTISCDIPKACQATVFWIDTSGQLVQINNVTTVPHGQFLRARCACAVDAAAGTAMVLVVASASEPPPVAELQAIFDDASVQRPLPKLEHGLLMVVNPDEVRPVSNPDETARGGENMEMINRLESLRAELGLRFRRYWGLVVGQVRVER